MNPRRGLRYAGCLVLGMLIGCGSTTQGTLQEALLGVLGAQFESTLNDVLEDSGIDENIALFSPDNLPVATLEFGQSLDVAIETRLVVSFSHAFETPFATVLLFVGDVSVSIPAQVSEFVVRSESISCENIAPLLEEARRQSEAPVSTLELESVRIKVPIMTESGANPSIEVPLADTIMIFNTLECGS